MNKPPVLPARLRRHAGYGAALAAAVLLAACGGSGDGAATSPPQAANEVPASATASALAYTQFTNALAATETGDPLLVTMVVPPTSETDEPAVLR